MRIGLVGCVKTKQIQPALAADLYLSPLFRGRRAYVEASCDAWFILSAKHGLVHPETELAPYDEALLGKAAGEKRTWAEGVLKQIDAEQPGTNGDEFEVHAGAAYRDFGLVDGLRSRGATVDVVCEHLSQGEQLAFYAGKQGSRAPYRSRGAMPSPRPSSQGVGGRYAALGDYLAGVESDEVHLTLDQIETIVGRALPASALRHRVWWANGGHSQADAWLRSGWLVDRVDLNVGAVSFQRAPG